MFSRSTTRVITYPISYVWSFVIPYVPIISPIFTMVSMPFCPDASSSLGSHATLPSHRITMLDPPNAKNPSSSPFR